MVPKNMHKMLKLLKKSGRPNNIRPAFKNTANALKMTDNQKSLEAGIRQRDRALAPSPLNDAGKKHYGFWQQNVITPDYMKNTFSNLDSMNRYKFRERTARIYKDQVSQVQDTPIELRNKWCVQVDRKSIYKTSNMGWTFSDDVVSSSKISSNVYFNTLELAIEHCRSLGMGYEIQYENLRYHKKKDYSTNFIWKGEPKDEFDIA